MDRFIGRFLFALALAHLFVGVAVYQRQLKAIWNDGVLNAVMPHYDRRAAFWFLLFAPVLFGLGLITNRAIKLGDSRILKILAWNLFGTGVLGVILIPISGFWALIALGPLLLRSASRARRPSVPEVETPRQADSRRGDVRRPEGLQRAAG